MIIAFVAFVVAVVLVVVAAFFEVNSKADRILLAAGKASSWFAIAAVIAHSINVMLAGPGGVLLYVVLPIPVVCYVWSLFAMGTYVGEVLYLLTFRPELEACPA